jgi:hypothetical protein
MDREIDLGQAESRDREVKIPVETLQLKEVLCKQPFIPMRVLRQLVVRNPARLQLGLGQMPDFDNGYT